MCLFSLVGHRQTPGAVRRRHAIVDVVVVDVRVPPLFCSGRTLGFLFMATHADIPAAARHRHRDRWASPSPSRLSEQHKWRGTYVQFNSRREGRCTVPSPPFSPRKKCALCLPSFGSAKPHHILRWFSLWNDPRSINTCQSA